MVLLYEEISLKWRPDTYRDVIFKSVAVVVLLIFIAIAIIITRVHVPKQKQERRVPIPERIARFINDQPKPKPRVLPKPKSLPLPPPIPKQFVKPRKKRIVKPLTKVQKSARKKAANSGLLALTKQLSGLVDTSSVDKMVGSRIRRGRNFHKKANVSGKILTAQAAKGQVNISQHLHGVTAGSGIVLDNNQRELARRLLAADGQIRSSTHSKASNRREKTNSIRGDNLRSEEEVAYVMDEHKSLLHMLYRRARRMHPGLKGKIVFQLTILPSGKVSKIRVISTELHDKSLEQDLIARIRLFDFGARPVESLTVTVPVEFLPS